MPTATRKSFCQEPCWWSEARNPGLRSPKSSVRLGKRSTLPSGVPAGSRGAIAARTRTGGPKGLASMTKRWTSCRRPKRNSPPSRTYRGTGAAARSTCTSSRAMASCCSATFEASTTADRAGADLHESLAAADRVEADFVKAVDAYVAKARMALPEETLPALRDGFDQPLRTKLDLGTAGITNVIWATSYQFDFSLVELPILDDDGYPIQRRGVTDYPGPILRWPPLVAQRQVGPDLGVGEDAAYIAQESRAMIGKLLTRPKERAEGISDTRELRNPSDIFSCVHLSASVARRKTNQTGHADVERKLIRALND